MRISGLATIPYVNPLQSKRHTDEPLVWSPTNKLERERQTLQSMAGEAGMTSKVAVKSLDRGQTELYT